ncbi:MAG: hemoglobin [Myxococcota bacterium]|jgi:hemoglobin
MNESLYASLGGADGVRALVDRFYDHMDTLPKAAVVRGLHPADLTAARDKLYWFLSGWTGGPPLYVMRKGHPRLRMRHMPFAIGPQARDEWMLCMDRALDELVEEELLREQLSGSFRRIAAHMQNRDED